MSDEVRKRNGNLPGMGGVFNTVNMHLYHYAGNNPVKYTDPDGRFTNPGNINPNDAKTTVETLKDFLPKVAPVAAIAAKGAGAATAGLGLIGLLCFMITGDSSQTSTETPRDNNSPSIRIQIQLNGSKETLATSGGIHAMPGTKAVTKAQGTEALLKAAGGLAGTNAGMAKSQEFMNAADKMLGKIMNAPGVPDGQNVLQENFIYKGRSYRIDLDSYRGQGNNLKE